MKAQAPAEFKALADFLVKEYNEKGKSVDELVKKRLNSDNSLKNYDEAFEEVIADSCESFLRDAALSEKAEQLYKKSPETANAFVKFFKKIIDKIKQYYTRILPQSEEGKIVSQWKDSLNERLQLFIDGINAAARNLSNKENSTNDGGVKRQIRVTQDGKQYVVADRQVIKGTDASKWGNQVTNYINEKIRNGEDVVVYALDGDPLTITRDTAGKAQFRNYVTTKEGQKRLMTDEEYAVKLRAESHIDELSKVSKKGNKIAPDTKRHPFAKDGFNYRTAYFLDFDGSYYRLTLSVGMNGQVNTVYNVGKINEAERPDVAQRPNRVTTAEDELISASINIISDSTENSNTQNRKNQSRTDSDLFDELAWLDQDDDVSLLTHHFENNNEAIGEVLKKTASIPISDRTLKSKIKSVLTKYSLFV